MKNILRWLTIAAFGGYGIISLFEGLVLMPDGLAARGAIYWFFILPFMLAYGGLFVAVAYFVLRRQYRHLRTLTSVLAAVVVFALLTFLPRDLGLYEHFLARDHSPWAIFLMLFLSLAALLLPFYGAGWTYRRVQAILSRFIPDHPPLRQTEDPCATASL
jgi:hypothetical protein